ncbi:hypothetical protein RND71_029916 [Anisodus tanguticus]|uniref:Uncharacterized protein n=1 Tax=Anisodus tanguticus TaxID=243964 RepID=A0AAE1UZ64_9SOLA|nr:hypothetical protein RND71_029916 [Anisodus tanguticus]
MHLTSLLLGLSFGFSRVQKQAILRTKSICSSFPLPISFGSIALFGSSEVMTFLIHFTKLISEVVWKNSSDGSLSITSTPSSTPKLYISHLSVNFSV